MVNHNKIITLILVLFICSSFIYSLIAPISTDGTAVGGIQNPFTENINAANYTIENLSYVHLSTLNTNQTNNSLDYNSGMIAGDNNYTYIKYINGMIIFQAGE